MTAMLTEQLALPQQSAHSVADPISLLAEENRAQAAKQLEEAEPGSFVTYTEDCVERPGMRAFWYSQEYGWQDPESSGVPICFKSFNGQIMFGLFLVTGVERREQPVRPFAGEAQPPRCWFIKGSLCLEGQPETVKVKGRFIPNTFQGEVMLDRTNL